MENEQISVRDRVKVQDLKDLSLSFNVLALDALIFQETSKRFKKTLSTRMLLIDAFESTITSAFFTALGIGDFSRSSSPRLFRRIADFIEASAK